MFKNNIKPHASPFMHSTYTASTVYCKPTEYQQAQMHGQYVVQVDDSRKQTYNLIDEIKISDEYFLYRDEFIQKLTRSQRLGNGHLSNINVAKLLVKLLSENTKPDHSATYRAAKNAKRL